MEITNQEILTPDWKISIIEKVELILPYPPSFNHYWRHKTSIIKGKMVPTVYISKEGITFRDSVNLIVKTKRIETIVNNEIWLNIFFVPPDNRKRDIDNPIKGLLDAMQHAGVYKDDSQIRKLSVEKLCPEKDKSHTKVEIITNKNYV